MSDRKAIPIEAHLDDDSDERSFLGSLMAYPVETTALLGMGADPALFGPACRPMFEAMSALIARGAVLNIITLTDELRVRGELENVGGAYEVSRLATFFECSPAAAEGFLARMRRKAAMRHLAANAAFLSEAAGNWGSDPCELAAAMRERADQLERIHQGQSRPKWLDAFERGSLSGKALHQLEIFPREKLLSDWLCESDLGFLFAARGVGKTWLSWLLAMGIADGRPVGPWSAPVGHPVLYIDGEMPLELIQTRNALLAQAGENLHYINHEYLFDKTGQVLNLTDRECQQAVTALCLDRRVKLLVLDNLSCLFRGVSENDADAWELILPWLMDLRRQKIAVLFVVHAGRNGQMRGTSRREDPAAWVIRLDDATDATCARSGAKFVSSFTKPSRNTPDNPPPLEWTIITNAGTGEATVTYKQAEGADAVLGWVRNGLTTCSEIAVEMGVTNGTVSKLATKLIEAGKLTKAGRGYALADGNSPANEGEE